MDQTSVSSVVTLDLIHPSGWTRWRSTAPLLPDGPITATNRPDPHCRVGSTAPATLSTWPEAGRLARPDQLDGIHRRIRARRAQQNWAPRTMLTRLPITSPYRATACSS